MTFVPCSLPASQTASSDAHDQSGAVADHADLTVEVDVVQPVFGCRRLERIGLHRIVEAGPPVVPNAALPSNGYLGVEGAQ